MLDRDSSLEEIRRKYDEERDKRIRLDKNEQFVEIDGEFSYFADDPYGKSEEKREALAESHDVIIIGGGFGGLLAGARLRNKGYDDICIVEKGSDFGGTWYWNRYPGVQCDIESYIYMPLLEETGYMPTLKYAFGDEIREHCVRIAKTFDLYKNARFQTEVKSVDWDEASKLWTVRTGAGDSLQARFVCMANGPLNRPKLPGIPGIAEFKGHTFHTSRWDYDYTGGDSDGGLSGLADKRVAVIGTGATALQCVPHVAEHAKHLYVVQRTPTAVDERNNRPTDDKWARSLPPGWQKTRADNFIALMSNRPEPEDLVNDCWTDLAHRVFRGISSAVAEGTTDRSAIEDRIEQADFESMQAIRDRADRLVADPSTAEALKPYYRKLCKRPGFHDEYLEAFNRSNVSLVDTAGQGVSRITETSFFVGDEEFEVDCIIFATGFEVGTSYTRRSGYDVTGVASRKLSEKWAEAPATFLGIQSHDFPNLFFMGSVQGTTGINLTQTLDEQAQHIAHALGRAKELGASLIEVSSEAEGGWCRRVETSGQQQRQNFFDSCTPGYYNGEGQAGGRGGFWEHEFAGTPLDFFEILRDWRKANHLPGLLVDHKPLSPDAKSQAHMGSLDSILVRLQPELRRLIERLRAMGAPQVGTLPVEAIRQIGEAGAKMRGPGPDLLSVQDATATNGNASVPVRIYRAVESPRAVLVYLHGGGWTIGSVDEFDAPMRKLAVATGAAIVSVDYRLAPEHPFPAAPDDTWTAVKWASSQLGELAVDNAPLFIGGDSAGGNLSAATCLTAKNDPSLEIAGQILLYPAVAGDPDSKAMGEFESPFLTQAETKWFYDQYVPNAADRKDPRVAPLLAKDHSELPPALIITAEFDLLRAEGTAYADTLRAAGNHVECTEYLGAIHGFFSVGDETSLARKLADEIGDFVARHR